MKKRADLSINTIVAAALALIVLVVLVFIFSAQAKNIAGGFFATGNQAKAGLNGTKCQTLFGDRVCDKGANQYTTPEMVKKYELVEVPPQPGKTWTDCNSKCYEIRPK